MTREIRRVETEKELELFTKLQANAYPGVQSSFAERLEHLERLWKYDKSSSLWGMWEGDNLIAGARLLDFSMNYMGTFIPAGGIGSLAVGLTHKKKGAARDFMLFFLDRCQQRQQTVAMLYPFRPDFYHRMGFGYGTKMNAYRFRPHSLPSTGQGNDVRVLVEEDAEQIRACHDEYANRHHGWCTLSTFELRALLHVYGEGRAVGYFNGDRLEGYLTFDFQRAHETSFLLNDLVVRQWIWNTPAALEALCGFMHRQHDQFDRISYSTQDANFHHLLQDVRNGTGNLLPGVAHETNTAGVGLMYRIVSIDDFLDTIDASFGGVDLDLPVEVEDTFRPRDSGIYRLTTRRGIKDPGTPLRVTMADLSSLLMGSVTPRTLYDLGKVEARPGELAILEEALGSLTFPRCVTLF